jgi:hypothetical protein
MTDESDETNEKNRTVHGDEWGFGGNAPDKLKASAEGK